MRVGYLALAALVTTALSTIPARAQAPPQPGPEHQILKSESGTWDASIEMAMPGGGGSMTSKGEQVDTLGCGGLCLITEFKGEMMPGMMFEGHGLTTYDSTKKKYVGSWTDSMSVGLMLSEGTYDPAAKTMTSWSEGPDMTGKMTKSKSVNEYPDADHKTMTLYMTGPDGKDVQAMKISYTRRK